MGRISDLTLVATTDSTAQLSFTEVDAGFGEAANYDVRVGLPNADGNDAMPVARGSCTGPMAGGTIGANRTCAVEGLTPATDYVFRITAFRGSAESEAWHPSRPAVGRTKHARSRVASLTISPTDVKTAIGETVQLEAVPKDSGGNALDRRVTWASADSSLAIVSSTGAVMALKTGTTTITAASDQQTAQTEVTITSTETVLPSA